MRFSYCGLEAGFAISALNPDGDGAHPCRGVQAFTAPAIHRGRPVQAFDLCLYGCAVTPVAHFLGAPLLPPTPSVPRVPSVSSMPPSHHVLCFIPVYACAGCASSPWRRWHTCTPSLDIYLYCICRTKHTVSLLCSRIRALPERLTAYSRTTVHAVPRVCGFALLPRNKRQRTFRRVLAAFMRAR
ncbi:hypothetical protein AVEN_110292-1 [Araneus ventricosus]|uniref:Uncharacterized protein n=1 Tax=Araneus ventricosus TaxID=182803 RepID=A0A4Y2DPA8_ARAVE|nr:hypothetical protein AVEN_110292-1 [Araneus ventricosus]